MLLVWEPRKLLTVQLYSPPLSMLRLETLNTDRSLSVIMDTDESLSLRSIVELCVHVTLGVGTPTKSHCAVNIRLIGIISNVILVVISGATNITLYLKQGIYNRWIGLLDNTGGLDRWTGLLYWIGSAGQVDY